MSEQLRVTKTNMRRLRAIYLWLTLAGAAASSAVALLLTQGADFSGPIIAVAAFAFGLLAIGGGMLIARGRIESAAVIRLLRDHPERVERVYPKQTESNVLGATVASYRWLVIEDDVGQTHDLYAGGDDLDSILREVRACAPGAHFDPVLRVERWNVR